MPNRSILTAILTLPLILTGCQSPETKSASFAPQQSDSDASDNKSDEKDAAETAMKIAKGERKLAKLRRDLAEAKEAVTKAGLDIEHQRQSNDENLGKARREVELAQAVLAKLRDHEIRVRIEQTRLNLIGATDRLREAEEELQQLQMMYSEEDLADKTAEIVIRRGQRRIERARQNLEIRKTELNILESETIPLEIAQHEHKVDLSEKAANAASRKATSDMVQKQISFLSAENNIIRIKEDIQTAKDEVKQIEKDDE